MSAYVLAGVAGILACTSLHQASGFADPVAPNARNGALEQAQRDAVAGNQAYAEGNFEEARQNFRRSYELRLAALGPHNSLTLDAQNDFAAATEALGDYAKAESIYRTIHDEQSRAPEADRATILRTLSNLAVSILQQGRFKDAETLDRQIYSEEKELLGEDDPHTLATLDNLGSALLEQGRYEEAESSLRQLYQTRLRLTGEKDPRALDALANLARAIGLQKRHEEAEELERELYQDRKLVLGADHPDTLKSLADFALEIEAQDRHAEAEPLLRDAAKASAERLGETSQITLQIRMSLARVLRAEGKFESAAEIWRGVCPGLEQPEMHAAGSIQTTRSVGALAQDCYYQLALDLLDMRAPDLGGGDPGAVASESFDAAQRSGLSENGLALSRSAAIASAESTGAGELAEQYEKEIAARDALKRQFARLFLPTGRPRSETASLEAEIGQEDARVAELGSQLTRRVPAYWNLRSPEPVTLPVLQTGVRGSAALLHSDEALVVWSCRNDDSKGLVFAVSREAFAWAPIGLDGTDLAARVKLLRSEIDAHRIGSQSASYAGFDRQKAFEIYLSLLGDKSVQHVIANKHTLLIVPCGTLESLPPGLLVDILPPGGTAGDLSPQALRATHWLITDKAIGILPSVSSLAILRQRQIPGLSTVPLLAFAAPKFENPKPTTQAQKWFNSLRPLPGTQDEAEDLKNLLHARNNDVLLGARASKLEFERRVLDGSLGRARVLEFATHGFMGGEIPGLDESALALSNPGSDRLDDGLLRASEIAMLRLGADWVVLSACNTAISDEEPSNGVSGFAEAFFEAGARTLLLSHWRLRDDAAARLVAGTFRAQSNRPQINKAEALRQSMMELMNDSSLDSSGLTLADPSAWAPFVVMGDVD